MEARKWMASMHEARFARLSDAVRASGCSPTLLRIIEEGSVTLPEIAERIGAAYGMSREQIDAITCQETVRRRGGRQRSRPQRSYKSG